MKIMTKAFGEIEVSEKQRIKVLGGLLGFEEIEDYVLLDFDENSPFFWLQAEKIEEIAFIIIDPSMIVKDYVLKMDEEDKEVLSIQSDEDVLIFSIVTINEDPKNITANLLGPVVINKINKNAKQIINSLESYSVREPLVTGKGV